MKKNLLFALICLAVPALFSVHARAAFINVGSGLKLSSVAVVAAGVEFSVRANRDLTVNPDPACKNKFIVLNSHADFNLMAALLITAAAQKKKIDFYYDEFSNECAVEVISVKMY